MKVVVTGVSGSGKSRVVRAAMECLGWTEPGGFHTHWGGHGRGAQHLYIETWDGQRHPMARRVATPPDAVPYELDRATFVRVAAASLADAAAGRPVVIDELGAIELSTGKFAAAVAKLFRGPAPVLAVIQQRALAGWLEIIGAEHVTRRCEVAPDTRAGLPAQIAAWFGA